MYMYNTQTSTSLGDLSPFECLYLRSPRDPLSLNTAKKITGAWIENFGDVADLIFRDMGTYFRRKYNYNSVIDGPAPDKLKRGDWVLAYKHRKGSGKLTRKYDGPYSVKKQTAPGVYLLVNINTQKE